MVLTMGYCFVVMLEHFDQIVEDCLIDCVNCLLAFANNKVTSYKAIALLSICEDRVQRISKDHNNLSRLGC